ncbi:MAG TPA: MEDS domain-containing protein [Polyangia bacterium]|nr:MEDS domain-containing protein [Polyangia bacterium]
MTFTRAGFDDVHRGRHICLPFETDAEKQDAVASFVIEGLTQGKRCLFIGTPEELSDLRGPLEAAGICLARVLDRQRMIFRTCEEAYLDNGVFNPDAVLARIDQHVRDAVAGGFTGLHATGELVHVPADEDWQRIVQYEAQVNENFARLPLTTLCRYPRAVVPAQRVQDVLRTHPVAIVRSQTCSNPFYEQTQLALSNDSQARLDWQLRQMRVQNRTQRRLEDQTYSAVTAAADLATQLEALRERLRELES